MSLKKLGDRAPGGQLDFMIGIPERQPEAQRQAAPDRGLSGAHEAHEHNAASGSCAEWRDGFSRCRGVVGVQHGVARHGSRR